eukprot:3430581-Amphidinium_carterae.1
MIRNVHTEQTPLPSADRRAIICYTLSHTLITQPWTNGLSQQIQQIPSQKLAGGVLVRKLIGNK